MGQTTVTDFDKLHPGWVVDVKTTYHQTKTFESRFNGFLSRFTPWRLGRSNGRRAFIYVVFPQPRFSQIILWPRAKR